MSMTATPARYSGEAASADAASTAMALKARQSELIAPRMMRSVESSRTRSFLPEGAECVVLSRLIVTLSEGWFACKPASAIDGARVCKEMSLDFAAHRKFRLRM